ncbi:unnamed protein product [Symbiodinium microadriaticum]|nr:unnamed protein product [Symbiodinium microadriaticum]
MLACLSMVDLAASQTCWSGYLDGQTFTPGMLVTSMDNVICTTTTTTVTMTSLTSTSSTMTGSSTTTSSATMSTSSTTSSTATTSTGTTSTVSATTSTSSSATATSSSSTTSTATSSTATVTTITSTSATATMTSSTTSTATGTTSTSSSATVTITSSSTVTMTTSTSSSATATETTSTSSSLTGTTSTSSSASTTSTTATATTTTTTSETATSTTTASTSTTPFRCASTFILADDGEEFGGLNRGSSSACDNLPVGTTCEVTFNAGSGSDLSGCIAAGTYTWFCPALGSETSRVELHALDPYIQCRVCEATFVDTDEKTGDFAGKVVFGPNMVNGVVDETVLDYYVVLPMDDCGHIPLNQAILGHVAKSSTPPICCEQDMYEISISLPQFAYNKIVVVPAGSNYSYDFLDDGVVIDLVDLTTTTTTTSTASLTTTSKTMTSTVTATTLTSTSNTATESTTVTGELGGSGWVDSTMQTQLAPVLMAGLALVVFG